MRKLIIVAGTGFLGRILINHFSDKFDEIVVFTRRNSKILDGVKYVHWDAKSLSDWKYELENADVLINLAGKSVDCRYTNANKKEIYDSRIDSTNILNRAVLQCVNPPKHWLNSSTSTIYRFSLDKQMDEYNGEIGDDFSMNIAKSWEKSFFETVTPQTLKTALRTSIVLGKKGGAFIPIKMLTMCCLGGKQGDGNQFISWVHEKDFSRAVAFIIEKQLSGVVNVVSPKPITNRDFMATLRSVLKMPFGIPTSLFLLKIGSFFIRTESELVLKSRNVIPKRLTENGFKFEYSDLTSAFVELLKK